MTAAVLQNIQHNIYQWIDSCVEAAVGLRVLEAKFVVLLV